MRFKGLDLNLISALNLLLQERSVSRAAEKAGLSQPAMSAALLRLREYFSDELLIQHGKKLFITSYAESLQPHLQAFLRAAEALVAASAVFEPQSSTRLFRVVASDYVIVAVLAPLAEKLAESAPGIRFEFIPPDEGASARLSSGAVDLLITPSEFLLADQPAELLLEERHVVVGWRDHPLFQGHVTEDELLRYGYVAVRFGPLRQPGFADRHFEHLNKSRRIDVQASSFTSVPWLLVGTQRLSILHERLARKMSSKFDIAYAPLPFAFPVMREMLQFHQARASDQGLTWLRAQMRAQVTAEEAIHVPDRKLSKHSI